MYYSNERTNLHYFLDSFDDIQELKAIHDSHKSFYNRAYIAWSEKQEFLWLISYNTVVAVIDAQGFHRLWDGYSSTTMRHVNEFIRQSGMDGLTAQEWRDLPVEFRNWWD